MEKFKIGQDFENLVPEEYKNKIAGKIGGYCIIDTGTDLLVQGTRLINLSNLYEPLIQMKFYRGQDLNFMKKEWEMDMNELYTIVNIPISEESKFSSNTNDSGVVLSFWTFKDTQTAYDMHVFLSDVIEKSIRAGI